MTYSQPMLWDSSDVISSEASAAGSTPCSLPDGPGQFGREAAPASRSVSPASAAARKTNGTSGPSFSDLLNSADPLLRSVSRSLQRMACAGSMEYSMTLKVRVTPAGRVIPALRARGRQASDSDFSGELLGWNSPTGTDHMGNGHRTDGRPKLPGQAMLAGYPKPKANEKVQSPEAHAKGFYSLMEVAELAGWATPAARDHKSESASVNFNAKRDAHSRGKPLSYEAITLGATAASSPAATTNTAASALNPAMSRWLQGFPKTWDEKSPNYEAWLSVQEAIAQAGSGAMETASSHK